MKQCPHCNSEILDDSIFCDRCGKQLMVCADCGTFARGKFCPNCGGKNIIDALEYEQRQQAEPISELEFTPIASPTPEHTATLTSADGSITLHIDDSAEYIIGRKSPQFGRLLAGCSRMSRTHAAINWDNEENSWLLTDLASAHGTMINHYKLDSEVPYYLKDGSTVTFANYDFNFEDSGGESNSEVDYNDPETCRKAALQGDVKAMVNLGSCYISGLNGVDVDKEEAVNWLMKAVDHGDTEAYCFLGMVYSDSDDPEFYDYDEAMKWYQKGAEMDDGDCMWNIGILYSIKENDTEACKWYRKAMHAGNAMGAYNLALMYYDGRGVEKDEEKAIRIMRKASELGESMADEWLNENG